MNRKDEAEPADATGVDQRRRLLLQGGLGMATLSFAGMPALAASGKKPAPQGPSIGFASIGTSTADEVRVPAGYTARVLFAWGDPVSAGPPFSPDAGNPADEQALQAGMHHSGMQFLTFGDKAAASSTRGLLCVNHQSTDDGLLHRDGMFNWNSDKARKAKAAHGVSVTEVAYSEGRWRVVRPSPYGRRITGHNPAILNGPAAGSLLLATADDPAGHLCLGTLANRGSGMTPWGTFLSCEGDFAAYFVASDPAKLTPEQKRYGLSEKGGGYRWHESDPGFDVALTPNESNRFGWVVEVDPWDPKAPPIKRTALGRMMHEGATTVLARDGRVVVYMGDGGRQEYIYKFVSRARFDPARRHITRAQHGELLDAGTLYVARLDEDGRGRWVDLTHGKHGLSAANGFRNQAEVLVKTRLAADHVDATKMDRPQGIAVHPLTREVYCALAGDPLRGTPGSPGPDLANPRARNAYGHIIRWREDGADPAALQFKWDVYALCGDPRHADESRRGSVKGDAFGGPGGLWFDAGGRLWIQTDVRTPALNQGDFANLGNNQMLAGDVRSGETRRFLTGPRGSAVTGISAAPDGCTLFVSIQHPGENKDGRSDPARPKAVSNWPDGESGGRPRSATIVIRREDGGVVGT